MQASVVGSGQKVRGERLRHTCKYGTRPRPLHNCASIIWLHDLAALVQMASDGKVVKEGLLGVGMNDRCMSICT